MICEINISSITVLSETLLSNTTDSGFSISAIKISENKIFIAHNAEESNYLYAMICEINRRNYNG